MDISNDTLCPGLYLRLQSLFGDVRISNQGERWIAQPVFDAGRDRYSWSVTQRGENYQVNCPFCNDRRHRLSVHHMYGQYDPATGRTMTWLANCYNDTACLAGDAPHAVNARHNLEMMLFGPMPKEHRSLAFPVQPGKTVDRNAVVAPPGEIIRLDALHSQHKAYRYLAARHFNPVRLGKEFGLAYCVASTGRVQAYDRLLIPVVRNGEWVSWQARFIGETDWKWTPKYYTCPGSSVGQYLYNDGPQVADRGIVVVTEGAMNVWRLGQNSLATFGKQLTTLQMTDLMRLAHGPPVLLVFCYDVDRAKTPEDAQRQEHKDALLDSKIAEIDAALRRNRGRAVRIRLSRGADAAMLSRTCAWNMIFTRLRRQGLEPLDYVRPIQTAL